MKTGFRDSLRFASEGLLAFFRTERNGQRQAVIAVLVIIAGIYFQISSLEWLFVTLCIGSVIGMEMMNAAVEKACDLVTHEIRPEIKLIKDLSAGAVLFVALAALVAGLIIFLPYVLELFR